MIEEKKPPPSERLLPIVGRAGLEALLDSHAAAALLGVHPRTLQRMVLRGQIAGVQVGKLWRFRASATTIGSTRSKLANPRKTMFSADKAARSRLPLDQPFVP